MWFKNRHHKDEERQYANADKDCHIGPAQRVERQFATRKLHSIRTPYDGADIKQANSKGIHLDTACRRLRSTTNPHQYGIDNDALNAHTTEVNADETRRSRTDCIEESLCKFLFQRHAGERVVPFKETYQDTTRQYEDYCRTEHNLRIHVIKVGNAETNVALPMNPFQYLRE